jgi:hypothetical protein
VPRIRDGIGAVTSSIVATSVSPSHLSELGPIVSDVASRVSAARPRSVIAQRFVSGLYSATLKATWLAGSPRPLHA